MTEMEQQDDVVTPAPGSCKGFHSPIEDACKKCIIADKCQAATKSRLSEEKTKTGKDEEPDVEEVIPESVRKTYRLCVKKIADIAPKATMVKGGTKTVFNVGKRKALVVEMVADKQSIYRVVVRNYKSWPKKVKFTAKKSSVVAAKERKIKIALSVK